MKDKEKEVEGEGVVDASLIFEETSISRHFTKSWYLFLLRRKKTMDNWCRNYVPSVPHTAQNILHNCRLRSSFND